MRSEYNQYCQWAVKQLDNVLFNCDVQAIEYDNANACYKVYTRDVKTGQAVQYFAKQLVLGTGTSPYTPSCCKHITDKAVHSGQYLTYKQQLQSKDSITIIGSGQSAAEIFYDLLADIDSCGYELSWMTRSARFFPLEYSKLTLEMTSPEYIDYFYRLPSDQRDRLIANQKNLYKGINGELINAIYDLLYIKRLSHDIRVNLFTHSELKTATHRLGDGVFDLQFLQCEQAEYFRHQCQGLVLATGYEYRLPAFIDGITERICWDQQGRFAVHKNFSIDHTANEIFVQNVGLHTHGFVTPDLGMVCYRNSEIIKSITGQEYYPLEQRIAFQQFSAPKTTTDAVESEEV